MATTLSLTKVRADLYKIVDSVLETGTPVEIERRGKKVRIILVKPVSKLDNLVKRPGTIVGKPEDVVHVDWSGEWTETRRKKKRR
jgi:hypothetical protein